MLSDESKEKAAKINFKINGKEKEIVADPDRELIDLIRKDLGLTGAKKGCDDGSCGACTVLLGGTPVKSCMIEASAVDGKEITTIEGIGGEEDLHPIQESFLEEGAVQCGFCTPGMILKAKALLTENPNPSEEEIRRYISGNLCRCTGYTNIVKAIKTASEKLEGSKP